MREKPDRPDAKVPGGTDVTFKHGEPVRIDLTVEYFVDDWFTTDFLFDIDDGVAEIACIRNHGDSYWIDQNEQARRKAYETVAELPIVDEVVKFRD